MKPLLNTCTFLVLISLCLPVLAAGFIKFDGVDGESRDKDHKGWIDVMSVSPVAAPRDSSSGMASGKRQHKPVSITKPIDKASPILAKALTSGRPLSNVTLDVDGQITVLQSVKVQSITTDSSGNEVVVLVPVAAPSSSGKTPGGATGK